ncbi:hypothetical protein RHGRI_032874 [Rhododendron griersonianum]|uniref:Uncharacterized protein n=1 Tax=Rhododendron griersonianum TaxID=479676 RepID=A0AAV6IE39_9ERIC|nr:hypothetical protein RHGRI_032874 [Rhododendron griersonianum]
MAISKALIASIVLSLLVLDLVQAAQADQATGYTPTGKAMSMQISTFPVIIAREPVPQGAAYHRGQTCATGHAEPAARDANAFLPAHLEITMLVLATLP